MNINWLLWFQFGVAILCGAWLVSLLLNHQRMAGSEFAFRLSACLIVLAGSALFIWAEPHRWDTGGLGYWYWAFAFVALRLVGRLTGHPDPFGFLEEIKCPLVPADPEEPREIPPR